jgi:hypothetical protein
MNSFQINLSQVESCHSFVSEDGEAYFAFTMPNNSISCVKMQSTKANTINNTNLLPIKFEMNQPNIVKRLWSGITRAKEEAQSIIVSYKFLPLANNKITLIGLCKDFKIKIWNLQTMECVFCEDMAKYIRFEEENIIWDECKIVIRNQPDKRTSLLTLCVTMQQHVQVNRKKTLTKT